MSFSNLVSAYVSKYGFIDSGLVTGTEEAQILTLLSWMEGVLPRPEIEKLLSETIIRILY